MNLSRNIFFLGTFTVLCALNSCNDNSEKKIYSTKKEKVTKRSFNTNFDGKLYSVPSPVQTILFIHSLTLPFDSELLHPFKEAKQYKNITVQALNFGIYCTDIAYLATNNQSKTCLSFLNPVKKLAKELEISNVFNPSFSYRFQNNIENQDSIIVILNNHFSRTDLILKESDRKNISALILTGGWLKSMYISTQLYKKNENEKLLQHIGQQKQNLETVIGLIEKHNISGQNDEYISNFVALGDLFKKVTINYEFITPITDKENKTTRIKNKIHIDIEKDIIDQIIEAIEYSYLNIITL